jgi:hypothetical protein
MARGKPWPENHIELLKRAVIEKRMPVKDLAKLFGRSVQSVRMQCQRQNLSIPTHEPVPDPDMDFFDSYPTPRSI